MSFDIPQLHIADNSPEAQMIRDVIARDHVTVEEAVLKIIRSARAADSPRNFITEGKGIFNAAAEAQILDEAVAIAFEERRRPASQSMV